MTFKILCEVSGGVTGHRRAYLKSNGIEVTFPDAASAEAAAERLRSNISPFATARFSYTTVRVED